MEVAQGIVCPEPKTKLICKNTAKLKVIVQFELKRGKCLKFTRKIPIKIKCPKLKTRVTKCKNGVARKITITYVIKKCECRHRKRVKSMKCPCPKSRTIRSHCKKGNQKVVIMFYVRFGMICKQKKKSHHEICDKNSGWKPKYACQCYHYGQGNILSFDRRRLVANSAGKCSMLLSEWINKKSECSYKLYAVTHNGKYEGQLIHFMNNQYLLTEKKKLFINGHPASVPHSAKRVRIFYSGEYLQFVVPKCTISIAYNGHGGGYLNVGVYKGHNFVGLCGNCNGNPIDDTLNKTYTGGRKCEPVSGLGNLRKCLKEHSKKIGHLFCGRLAGMIQSSFLKCGSMAFHFFRGCIKDVCAEWPNKEKMHTASCKVHSLAAEACSERNIFLFWRNPEFCPLECGSNKEFVAKMNPCPKTCENHFFGTSRRCFKLPRRNGCECKKGHVLDGNMCVKPTKCKCLDKVCVDRYSKTKCLKWMAEGRCTSFPEVMKEFCQLTCKFCTVKCEDQISSNVCQKTKKKGQCKLDFYKQMCRLTCFPESCKCPNCEDKNSQCHPVFKYKISKKICYKLNPKGQCIPLVTRTYSICGECSNKLETTRTPCDFCKGFRVATTVTHFRDKSVKKKCKSLASHVKEQCQCRIEKGSQIKCLSNTKMVKLAYNYGIYKCKKCIKSTKTTVLKIADCRGTWMTKTKCDKHSRKRFVTFHKSIASNCKCNYSARKVQVLCKCPKFRKKGPICENNEWIFYQVGYRMDNDQKCKKTVTKSHKTVLCERKIKTLIRCNKITCNRTKFIEKWKAEQCQCRLNVKKVKGGKCCCPKTQISQTPCLGFFILKKKIAHLLVNNACVTRIYQQKLRCRCPKRKVFKYCNKHKGLIVKGMTKYFLTKKHTCRKHTVKRKSPVLCRKVQMIQSSPCLFSRSHTKLKFRKISFKTLVRHGCKCVSKTRTYLEPCGCKNLKHKIVIPCPKKCIGNSHCPTNCYQITKWYKYHYSGRGYHKKCIRALLKTQKKKCCCPKIVNKNQKCTKGKYIIKKIAEKVLVHNKCIFDHKEIRQKIECPLGFIKNVFGKKMKTGKFVIKKLHGYISKCRCKTKTQRKLCLWKCPKKITKRICNKALKSVIIKVKYFVLRGCKCVRREKTETRKIFCPKYMKKLTSKCPKGSKHGVIVYKKSFQIGCQCRTKKITRKKLCACPGGWSTKPICKAKFYVKSKISFKIRGKKCKKSRRLIKKYVKCSKKVKIIPKCYKDTGIFVKFKVSYVIKKCKCVVIKKIIKRGHCHCNHKKNKKSIKCDRQHNKWLHTSVAYLLNSRTKKCQRKKFVNKRPVYCPKSRRRATHCNLVNNRRTIFQTFYVKKDCKCSKRRRTIVKKCGCPKVKPTFKSYCDKKKGNIVTVFGYKKWKEEANRCINVDVRKIRPLYCKRNIRIYKSKCDGKVYSETIVKKYKQPKSCSCKQKIEHIKRNCRCPTKVTKIKCAKSNHFMGRKILIFKVWNPKTKKCKTSDRKVYYHRCKCPKSSSRKFCKKGKVVTKSIVYELRKHRCIKTVKTRSYKVFCKKSLKKIVGKCNKKWCTKTLTVFARVNSDKKCICVWKKVDLKKCKCCGCPKKTSSTKCYKDKFFKTKIVYFIGKEGKCSYKCKPKQKVLITKLKCHIELPKPHWTKCDKSKCKKRLIKWKLITKACKCIKRKYLGPSKICCCKHKVKRSKFCKRGRIISLVKHIKLQNVKCKPVYKKNEKKIKCKKSFKKIVKKCDRKTCKQPVYGEKVVVNPNKCNCKKVMSLLYKQPCCCRKKSYKKQYCTGKCNVLKRVKYFFDKSSKSCVKKVKISKKCIKCPKMQGLSGRCNKKQCIKFKYHTKYQIKNCRCHKHVTKTGKVCCCPKPTPWSKTCHKNTLVYKQKFFRLHHGKCIKNIRMQKRKVSCWKKNKAVKSYKCDRKTCQKKIRVYKQRQHGCKCVETKRDYYKKCCCPVAAHKKICKVDKLVMNVSKVWYLRSNKCMPENRSNIAQTIDKCKNRKWVGKCDKKTKTRTLKIIIYGPKKCKCVPIKKIIRKLLCACPVPIKKVSHCDPKSCKKSCLFIYFVGPIHKKKCIRKVRKSSWRCCCLGKKLWTKKKCNRISGNVEIITFKKIFDKSSRSCRIKRHRRIVKTQCSKTMTVKHGKCQKHSGLQIIYKLGWKKNHSTCRCTKHKLHIKKLCSCKFKKCKIFKPKCVHHGYLQKKKVCYVKNGQKCTPQSEILRRKIECPHPKQSTKKCSKKTCKAKHIITKFKKFDCKCTPVTKVKEYTCCCPKPTKSIKCKDDVYEENRVHYQFNAHEKSCKQFIIKSIKPIHCTPKRTRLMKCNKKTCLKSKIIKYYKIVKCKCKLIKVRKFNKKCCCPKKKNEMKCYKKYGVIQHVIFNHQLSKGSCIVQKLVEQDKISCAPTKFIRSKCNKATKKRTIKIISNKRINCKCKKSIRTLQTLCACKKPRILKGKCKLGRHSVFQIEYRLKHLGKKTECVKAVIKLYSDPCKCKPVRVSKKCKYNQIQIRTIRFTLTKKKHRKYCHMQDHVVFQNIKCPKKRRIHTKCHKYKYKIITIFYQLKHCKCVKQRTTKEQACHCKKRNKNFSYCSDGVIFNVRERYYSSKGVNHCLMHSMYNSQSIKCHKNEEMIPLNKKCNIKKNYSYYQDYMVTWHKLVGCKCIKMSKKVTKLCKCAKDVQKIRCIADDTLKIYRMTVTKAGKHCLPKQEITTQDIQCTGKERDIKKLPCEKHGENKCFQKVKITEKWVENCKCKKKTVVVKIRCCVPKSISVKYCDAKHGQHVKKTHIFKLSAGKILYRKDDFLLQDKKVVKSTVYQRQETVCPPKKIIERCHKKSGKWLRRIISYKRVGCKCQKFVKNTRGKCKCPSNKDIVSKCKTEFQIIRSISYKLIGRHCVRFTQINRRRCSCPHPISRVYCDGEGRWVKCFTEFTFNKQSQTCNLEKRCVRWDQICPESQTIEGKCDKHSSQRRIHEISYETNEEKCTCTKSVQYSHEYCSCKHLNSKSTKCIDNLTVTRKTLYALSNGQCIPSRIKIKKKIHCPSSTKHLGKCSKDRHSKHAGFRRVKMVMFQNKNCHCVKKILISYIPCDCKLLHKTGKKTFCKNGDSFMTKMVYWVLIGKKCLKRTKYFKKDIVCSEKKKIKVGKCTKSLKSKIWFKSVTIFYQVVKNCKCAWKLKKHFSKVCRCPPKSKSQKCIKNKIIENKMEFFVKNKYSTKCVKRSQGVKKKLLCPKRWKTRKCVKKSCNLYVTNFSQVSRNCKCQTVKKVRKYVCCCPKPSEKKVFCDKKKHTLFTSWYTFKLQRKTCVRKQKRTSLRVRCERRESKVRIGKCINHYKTIYVINKKNKGCTCVDVVKEFKDKCGCPKDIKFHKGKCSTKFATDSWSALYFNKKGKKCTRKIIQKRLRRCKCPRKQKIIKCLKNHIKIQSLTKFILQQHSNSCQKMVSTFKHNIGCTTRPKLVKVWRSKCSKMTGYYVTVKKTFKVADKCKCVQFKKARTWPCNCKKIHPTKSHVRCTKDKFLMKLTTISYLKDKKCLLKVIKQMRGIKCHGIKKKVSKCDKKTKHKTIHIYKKKVSKCKCKWMLFKTHKVRCICPKPSVKIHCLKGKMFVRVKSKFFLREGKCILRHEQVNTPVRCDLGTKVTTSKCDTFSGYQYIKMITHNIDKCHCSVHSSRKKCRCRCPKPTKHTICEHRTGHIKTTEVSSQLKKCKCNSKRHVTMHKITCNKPVTRVTKCRSIAPKKDKYKTIIEIIHHRDGCKCLKIVKKKNILCGCNPLVRKIRKCVNDKCNVVTVTKRMKINGKCKRMIVDEDKTTIVCPRSSTKKICNLKSGVEKVTITKWIIRRCKCFRKTYIKKLKCKCNSQRRLIRAIKCNHKCDSIKIFQYQVLKHKKCLDRYKAKTIKCCCPKWKKTKSKCLAHIGMVKTTVNYLQFKKGKCAEKILSKRRKIHCSKHKKTRSEKLPKGIIKITTSCHRQIDCKCKLFKSVKFERWNCPKNHKTSKCVNVPESSIETVAISHKMMSKTTGCKKVVVINRIPTECPPDRTFWTKCIRGKHATYKMLVQITFAAKNCKCKKSIERTPNLCKCDKPIVKRHCEKSKGLHIKTLKSFVPNSRNHKQCIAVKTTQQFRVMCHKQYKFNHKSKCSKLTSLQYHVYKAEKRVGCECKTIWRSKSCRCRCPKTKIKKRCRIDNVREKIVVSYVLVKCSCKKLVSSHLVTIKCPMKTRSHHKCGGKNGKCISKMVTTTYKHHKCQCKKIQKVTLRKCCCPPSRKRKQCIKGQHSVIYISYKLTKNKCYRRSHHTTKTIHCTAERRVQMVGPCLGRKQKYKLTIFLRKGCKCVKKQTFMFRNCLCLKKSAAEIVFLVDQTVSSRHGNYQKMIRKLLARTVSMFPLGRHSYQFALIKYSEQPSIVFNLNDNKKHENIFANLKDMPYIGKSSNLAKALHLTRTKILKRSRPGILRLIYIISDGVNDKTGRLAFDEIKKLRKHNVKISAVAVKPSKKGLGFLKRLLTSSHGYLWELRNKKHVKDLPYQILRTICKKACPIGNIKRSKCSKATNCKGRTYIFGYKTVGKVCLRTVTKQSWRCCCPMKPKMYHICHKNHKVLVKMSWIFANKSCAKSIKKRDVSSKIIEGCRPKIQRHAGPCQKTNYRTIVTVKRQVRNCKCVKHISKKNVLCRCSSSKRLQVCKKDSNLVKIKLYQTMSNNKCIKRRDMSKLPIVCPKSRTEKSKCDKITCKRKIQIIKFVVKQCKCQHKLKTVKVKCCCPRNKETRRFCKNNKRVYHSSWIVFNRKLKTCVKKSVKKSVKLRCSKKIKTKYGKCNIPFGKVWYKLKQSKWRVLKNCKCIKMLKTSKIPCKCIKGKSYKRCTAGGVWKMFSLKYKLVRIVRFKQIIGKCVKVIKVVRIRKHKCKKSHKRVNGKCKVLDSSGNKYRLVKILSNVRAGCKCVLKVKHSKELCKCPKSVTKHKCVKNKYMVTFRSWFAISGHGKNVKCVLKTTKKAKKIACPKPLILKSKCSSKTQKHYVIKTLLYVASKCKCVRKFYVRNIKCDPKSSGQIHNNVCVDLMPRRSCEKLKFKGMCLKPSSHRDKICRKTCSRCTVCSKDMTVGFAIKYHSCLVADQRYGKRFKLGIIKNCLYHTCLKKCKSLSTCKSFDFYIGKKKGRGYCVLNKVNPKQLEISVYPRPMKLGTGYKDLQRHHAKRCLLSIKQCKKKCPSPKLTKLGKCKCLKIHGNKYCKQKSIIYYHVRGHSDRCLKRMWKGCIPCGHDSCNNWIPDHKCHIFKKKGRCGVKSIRKKCQKTCSKCKCSRIQSYTTKCDKTNHKIKISVITRKHRKHGKCIIIESKTKKSCSVCYKKPFRVVHKCRRSVRSITHIKSVKLANGVCHVISSNKYYSCSKCPRKDQYFVTNCKKGQLKLITKYSIREKGCCKFKIESRQFACSKCPQKQIRSTQCSEGYRLRHVYYYVRANPNGHNKKKTLKCVKRVYTTKEKCKTTTVCRDEMSAIDCKMFKKSDGCRQRNADSYRLCQATCGLC